MTAARPDITDALTEDGDTLDLGDGRMLRLIIGPDMETEISDFGDAYGECQPGRPDRWGLGWERRPAHFTGNAEKLHYGPGYYSIWWEPPSDVPRGSDVFTKLRQQVIDLLTWGFTDVVLELCQGEDHYGRPIVIDSASLGAIDSLDGYLSTVLRDLAFDLGVVS